MRANRRRGDRGLIGWAVGRTVAVALAGLTASTQAATYTVGPSGKDFTSIQAAVAAATSPNDVVEVYDGTYVEQVNVSPGHGGANGLTLRAATGQHPILSPTNSGWNLVVLISDRRGVTLQGFEITGSNIVQAVDFRNSSEFRMLDNRIHDLVIGVCHAVEIADYGMSTNGIVAGNSFYNIGDGSPNSQGSLLFIAYYNEVWWADTNPRYAHGLIFSNNVIRNVKLAYPSPGVVLYSKNMVIVDNDFSQMSIGPWYAEVWIGGDNVLFANNRIHEPLVSEYGGQTALRVHFGTNIVVNNNRIINNGVAGGAAIFDTAVVDSWLPSNIPTNVTYVNNVVDCVMGTPTYLYAMVVARTQAFLSNNVCISGSYPLRTDGASQGIVLRNNTAIGTSVGYGGPLDSSHSDPRNTWDGGFYSYQDSGGPYGTGFASPATIDGDAPKNTDTHARSGYWASTGMVASAGSVVVAHPSDTNATGARTKITYNTTQCTFEGETNQAFLIHVQADLRGSVAGLPGTQTNGLAQTLQIAHVFADGHFFATLQLAYNTTNPPAFDESTLSLFSWNARDYRNQYWQLAVAGNVTNSLFLSNDIRRIVGPPDSTLGHYGVDLGNQVVWANINHASDFAAFGRGMPKGTAVLIR